MAPPKKRTARKPPIIPQPAQQAFEPVDPVWLLKALALSLLAALVCAWLTVCLLFYQGDWQLILHPTHIVDRTPADASLAYEPIRFDATETGQPRLTGWWIPAQAIPQPGVPSSLQSGAKYAAFTILYLHDGSGSLSNTLPALTRLHRVGINVFAIDYRGFGQSDAADHPTETRMAQDAAAALEYLTTIRHIPAATIIPYGSGLGASLAANLAHAHRELPAVILDNPNPDPTATAVASHPSRIVPVRLLFRQHFEITGPLAALTTPKLLIADGPAPPATSDATRALQILFRKAASPSRTVTLLPAKYDENYQAALIGFLDEYLPHTAPTP